MGRREIFAVINHARAKRGVIPNNRIKKTSFRRLQSEYGTRVERCIELRESVDAAKRGGVEDTKDLRRKNAELQKVNVELAQELARKEQQKGQLEERLAEAEGR